MTEALRTHWHNPSSLHRSGQEARRLVELARRDIAGLIGARPREVIFLSGGTESADLAIRGTLAALGRRTIVSTRIEHAGIRDLLEDLQRAGAAEVRWAPVGRDGIVDPDALDPLLDGAALASIQWANNETGAIQPVERIGRLCRARGVLFHCDGTQWIGKMPAAEPRDDQPGSLPCDLLTFAPHKFHGPQGVGVLWVRRGVPLRPVIHGAQELGRRGGTENVPGIVGAGAAAREVMEWLADPRERRRMGALRDRFERLVLDAVPDALVNGPSDPAQRVWNTTNIAFPRLEAEALLVLLSERGVCASAGAACSSGSLDPSPVLLAMGIPEPIAHGSLRFSISRETTADEIERGAAIIAECAARLRASSAAIG